MATWKIESMIVKPQDGSHTDVVVTATYRCSASDGDKTASNYGSMGFASPGDDFVAYPDLTEADVLGWVWANGVDKDATEASIQSQINGQINPTVIQPPLPWA